MAQQQNEHEDQYEFDPVYLNSLREAIVILIIFFVFLGYCIPVCFYFGNRPSGDEVPSLFGIPAWCFWGVLVPWIVANFVTAWFCFFYMKNDPLESDEDPDLDQVNQS